MDSIPDTAAHQQAGNPWALAQALRDGDVTPDDVRDELLDLIATRSTPQERDALVAESYTFLGLRLADVVREVERRLLERLAAAEGAR